MRSVMLAGCGIIAGGVFLAMYLAIWSARHDPARAPGFRQPIVSEFVWATIPILMLLAAAFPAAITIISRVRH
jgi:heme/copper-type cytochrome/quinol oxidase subunit 2